MRWPPAKPPRNLYRDVKAFHEKMAIPYAGKPRTLDFETLQFRLKFMREELAEYELHADAALHELDKHPATLPQTDFTFDDAHFTHELAQQLDALVDMVYVTVGTAYLQGLDFNAAWDRVHAANMAKEPSPHATTPDSKYKFKITKPPGWEPPRHEDLVEDHAHRSKGDGNT